MYIILIYFYKMELSYKDIIEIQPIKKDITAIDTIYSYEEINKIYKNNKINVNTSVDEYTEFLFGMMEKIKEIKEIYEYQGYMNTFNYNDICDIINECVRIEVVPEIQSDDDSEIEEDDYAGI
jgi:hypothetical protein